MWTSKGFGLQFTSLVLYQGAEDFIREVKLLSTGVQFMLPCQLRREVRTLMVLMIIVRDLTLSRVLWAEVVITFPLYLLSTFHI